MGHAIVEGEAVDERLQGGARRALRPRKIDLPVRSEEIRAAEIGAHRVSAVLHDDDREIDAVVEAQRLALRERLQARLQAPVERRRDRAAGRDRRRKVLGEVWCQERESEARRGQRLADRLGHLGFGEHAVLPKAVQHLGARRERRLGVPVGPEPLRRLRQRHQQRGFPEAEAPRLLAEIGERGRAHALEIAAEGRRGQIDREDALLREPLLQLQRPRHLAQLGAEAARPRLEKPCRLHGKGRCPGHDVPARSPLPGGARHGERVHADMLLEALILIGAQQSDIAGIDVPAVVGSRQAPSGVSKARRMSPSRSVTTTDARS